MSLRIGHNAQVLAVQRHRAAASNRMAVAMQRMSTGLRINSAADDAAGLSLSERLRGQIRGLERANRNIDDGISMLNVMDAALEAVSSILLRAREIAVQYNNDTYSNADRMMMTRELIQLSNEVSRIEQSTSFNGINLLQDATIAVTLQIGANQNDTMRVSLTDLFGVGLALVRPITFFATPWTGADIAGFDAHINDVAAARGRLGGSVNRLESARSQNEMYQSNLMQDESRIRDTDFAQEMVAFTRNSILTQSSTAILAQINKSRDRVADLLG